MKKNIFALFIAVGLLLGGSPAVNGEDCFDPQRLVDHVGADIADHQPEKASHRGDQRHAEDHHYDHLNAGGSVPSIPDWTTWECDKAHISHEIIETYGCYGPEGNQISRIILKVKGQKTPFLIGWGYDERATDPTENAYSALYKDGKWIVGARGAGFTTQESRNSLTFYIFLSEDFSVREEIEINVPEADLVKVIT